MSERGPERSPADPTVTPFPLALPAGFLRRLGYDQGRRLVGVYWEPAGDEAVFDDGVLSLTGADPWTYLELVRQPRVEAWLDEQAIALGTSDEPATHWLPVDGRTDRAASAPPRRPGTSCGPSGWRSSRPPHLCESASTRTTIPIGPTTSLSAR